jgi:hypothetical protein
VDVFILSIGVGFTGTIEVSTGMCSFYNVEKSPGDGINN